MALHSILKSLTWTCVGCVALAAGAAFAQAKWPERPVHLVVPFGAGGNTDVLARFLVPHLERELGQPVVVENRPGAGGTIGGTHVAKSAPDGYTVLIGSGPQLAATSPLLQAGYNPVTDLTPVARLSDALMLIVARKDFPANSLTELKQVAADKPESVRCGSAGMGTVSHLHCEDLARQLKVQFLHVPFKGSADAMNAVMAGTVDLVSNPLAVTQVKADRAKALAGGMSERHPDFPDVPAIAEAGFTLGVPGWFGIAAPVGTPADRVARLAAAVEAALRHPDASGVLQGFGQFPAFLGPQAYKEAIARDRQSLMEVERAAGLRKD